MHLCTSPNTCTGYPSLLCYTEKATPARNRPERQHNALSNRRKQCSPNETKPYSNPTPPRKKQNTPTNGHTPRRMKATHTRLTYTRMRVLWRLCSRPRHQIWQLCEFRFLSYSNPLLRLNLHCDPDLNSYSIACLQLVSCGISIVFFSNYSHRQMHVCFTISIQSGKTCLQKPARLCHDISATS